VTGIGRRATGVELADGERLTADVVVLNPDLPIAYRDLLPPRATPRRVRHLTYSPSCVVVHLGLDRLLEGAAHHNIHFAEDYQASFATSSPAACSATRRGTSPCRPCPSPPWRRRAARSGFVLVPAPNLHGQPIAGTPRARASTTPPSGAWRRPGTARSADRW
jgi:phytoene desaturase